MYAEVYLQEKNNDVCKCENGKMETNLIQCSATSEITLSQLVCCV